MKIKLRNITILDKKNVGMSNRAIARTFLNHETKESTVRGVLKRYQDAIMQAYEAKLEPREISKMLFDTGEHEDTIEETIQRLIDDGSIVQKEVQKEVPNSKKDKTESVEHNFTLHEDHYAALTRRVQRQADQLRIERKKVRESGRVHNLLEDLGMEINKTFQSHNLSEKTFCHPIEGETVGVLQLSDLHFGERIDDGLDNVYDLGVIAARLKKFVNKAKMYFNASGTKTVVIAMTGDLINSDRRLDEITANTANRSQILFSAVDVLQQLILDLNEDFNVTIASVCGNESRVGFDVGWSGFTASDSFDKMVHEILARLFEGSRGVTFIPMDDPLECVIDVNGSNLALIHGHNGLANQSRIEGEVNKMRARYAMRGVKLDYVICGHIHFANISDSFARSSGLVGSNAYSEKALNLNGKSSQNIYIFGDDGSIDGIKIDLEEYSHMDAYTYNEAAEAYKPVERRGNMIIQSVLV